ncbi:MAG: hypothetical protein R3Y05_04815 [bacterium]
MKKTKCPFCGTQIESKQRLVKEIIKNKEVSYIETYFYCIEDKEEFYDEETSKENYINLTDKYKEIEE